MTQDAHYLSLEHMYRTAPINAIYAPRITIGEHETAIEINLSETYFHAGQAVHGSVYFKMLDDAAFFASNALEREVFVLTTSFTTYLTRPISSGTMRSVGRVVNQNRSQFIAEAIAYDSEGREVGRGNGIFVRSKNRLRDVPTYRLPEGSGEAP